MNNKENNFHHLINANNNLNLEIKNLVSSFNDNDTVRQRYHENQVLTLLGIFIDEINMSDVLPDRILQIKFAKRFNFENKDHTMSLANL